MAVLTIEEELDLIQANKAPTEAAPAVEPAADDAAQPAVPAPMNAVADRLQDDPAAPAADDPAAAAAPATLADPEADLPPAATDLPSPPEAAGTWDVMSAAWKGATIRGDTWNYEGRQRNALAQDMFDQLSPERQTEVRRAMYGIKPEGAFWRAVVDAAAKDAAAGPDAASRWGEYPTTPEAFDAKIRERIIADKAEVDTVLAAPGGGFAEFLGETARVMTGPTNVAATVLGAVTGGVGAAAWRIIASEAVLNAGAEGIDAYNEQQVAREYGWEEPDIGQRMLFGAVLGGAFSGAVIGGAKLFGLYQARRASTQAATPDGGDALATEAAIDKAEAQLRDEPTGQELAGATDSEGTLGAIFGGGAANLPPVPADAPAGWVEIRNGIFAGESGGDYNALFGYQNRKGGKFSRVRLTEMSVDEAIAFSDPRGAYGQWVKGQIGRVATPMGAYQIVGTTLRAAKRGLGLQGDELMTPELQEQLGIWIYRQQGTGAWEGYRGPRKNFTPAGTDRDAPTFDSSRGYTGSGQVKVGDDMTIDVDYEVVDASTLSRASGPYQPRDRSRVNSDAWIADTAARLDPAQLLVSPTADRGAPIVGPDSMIESGNGRFGAILRAYERHPDRAAAYRGAIEAAGYTVPEGVSRPVLIARRRTELTDPQRVKMTVDAQDSGVAVMTPTEMAQVAARNLTPERLDRMDMRFDIAAPENDAFLRSYMETLPRSLRNAMSDAEGGMNGFGRKSLRDAIFARAWADPDIIELMTEGQRGDLKGLFDALETSAPAWAALKADIEAGRVLPEMDISGYVLDAMRMIATARRIAAKDKQPLAKALEDLLNSPDMIEGAVSPLTAALLRKFWRNGRAAPEDEVAGFLTRYAEDARKAGASAGLFDAPTPRDVLAAIDRATFGDLPDDLGAVRGFAKAQPVTAPPAAFAEGSASPDVQAADQAMREALGGPSLSDAPAETAPAAAAPDAIQAELAATRAEIAETAADLGDDFLSLPFEIEGLGRVTLREMLDDIDADAAHAAVLRACAITPGGAS